MSRPITKEDIIQNKKQSIKELNNMLEGFINDPTGSRLKKANLISYWIKDYVKLISFEEKFDPTKNPSYKRGSIVKVNFGFNVGCEYGGLHYGIVLDNNNAHHSPVVTVVPLTSLKSEKIHNNSVNLGNEIYRLVKLKRDTILKTTYYEQVELKKQLELSNKMIATLEKNTNDIKNCQKDSIEYAKRYEEAKVYWKTALALRDSLAYKVQHNAEQISELQKIEKEISRMKEGSVALVNQITTISKMRIYDPRTAKGVLANISLSAENMNKINEKLKELYIFSSIEE